MLLADQDRSLWNADQIAAGTALAEEALSGDAAGPYALQAAIAAEHVRPDSAGGPRWRRVAELYARLYEVHQSPVVRLNGAVAVAMANGPARGLELIDRIDGLDRYHLLHSARADLLRRLGRAREANAAYRRAIELTANPVERSFLERRLAEVETGAEGGLKAPAQAPWGESSSITS